MKTRTITSLLIIVGFMTTIISNVKAQELKHSYVFTSEGVIDTVAGANGTVVGGTIADGVYTSEVEGDDYIELPADEIAIYDYSAITLEARVITSDGLNSSGYTEISYFGDTYGDYGNNGYLMSICRASSGNSATLLYCGNDDAPWENEEGVTGTMYDDGTEHHIVSVVTDSDISLYLDGTLVGTYTFSIVANLISNIGTSYAWLCKGGYSGNPTWLGTIEEFNIYEGALSADTIAILANGNSGTAIIENTNDANVKVYPTPATDCANIQFSLDQASEVTYAIYSITGQEMESNTVSLNSGMNEISINTDNYNNGIYIYKLSVGSSITSGKFSVSK